MQNKLTLVCKAVTCILLYSCINTADTKTKDNVLTKEIKKQENSIIFDVPRLINMHNSELIATLGEPMMKDTLTDEQIKEDVNLTMTFQKDGYELAVDISPLTGSVSRAFIST